MSFQIDEKLMAANRAIITRNKSESDLLKTDQLKFKPGMAHYISENQKLWLSVEPKRINDNGQEKVRSFLEIITDPRLSHILLDYVNRDGGENNSMRGPLHSIVPTGTAPMNIASTTRVTNLNADRVDNMHVSVTTVKDTIVGRDNLGNINIKDNLYFNTNKVSDTATGIVLNKKDNTGRANLAVATIDSSTGILHATNSSKTGVMKWEDDVWKVGEEGRTSEVVTKSLYGHGNGIDADTVDNRHVNDTEITSNNLWTAYKIHSCKAPRRFGLGTDIDSIKQNDCNAVEGTGFFSTETTPANGAPNETGKAIIQQYIGSSGAVQIIEYIDSKNIYIRMKAGTLWGDWTKILTKSNIFNEGINIITQAEQPQGITNDDTYWYEII